jgi:hypothetical protein
MSPRTRAVAYALKKAEILDFTAWEGSHPHIRIGYDTDGATLTALVSTPVLSTPVDFCCLCS